MQTQIFGKTFGKNAAEEDPSHVRYTMNFGLWVCIGNQTCVAS